MNDDMNNNKVHNVLLELQQQGLIDANAITEKAVDNNHQEHTPWFIQVLFGFSGVFASLLFIGFLSLLLFETNAFDSTIALLIIGLSLSAAGFALFRNKHTRDNAFMSSLAFAISISGQAYVAFALLSSDLPEPLNVWLFLLIQSYMTLIMPNVIYRLLSTLVVLGCVVYLLNYYHLPEVSLGLLALITIVANLQRYSLVQSVPTKWRLMAFDIIKAIAYASALMLLSVSVYFISAEYGQDFISDGETFSYNYYLAQGLLILTSLYAAYLILERYSVKLLSTVGLIVICAIVILGVMSVYVSGLLATSLIIVIAIANSQRVLLGLGVLALISYIFWYYYQLDTSLLIKSISMLIIGIAMLLMRWLLVKRYAFDSTEQVNTDEQKERLL